MGAWIALNQFKYIKISNIKKLRYLDNYYKEKLYIIFLPGFMSDIDGKKPPAFKEYAVKNKLGFLAIESLVMVNRRENLPKEI